MKIFQVTQKIVLAQILLQQLDIAVEQKKVISNFLEVAATLLQEEKQCAKITRIK